MPIVAQIVDRLNKDGFDVWFDSSKLESGDNYDKRIANAIAKCKIFVPILSPQVKQDLCDGHLDRYYIATEWALLKQRVHNIESDAQKIHVMPLAISGYDERADYHASFPFSEYMVVNLMNTPISRFVERIKIK